MRKLNKTIYTGNDWISQWRSGRGHSSTTPIDVGPRGHRGYAQLTFHKFVCKVPVAPYRLGGGQINLILEWNVTFWFKFWTHKSANFWKNATHNSAILLKTTHFISMFLYINCISTFSHCKEISSKGNKIIKQFLCILCSSWQFLPLFSKIISIILHVSSTGTHNSNHSPIF